MIDLSDLVQMMEGATAALPSLYAQSSSGVRTPFTDIVIDSRQAGPGALFVALPGERTDGHQFVAAALRAGARAALVDEAWATQAGAALNIPIVRRTADLQALAGQPVLLAVADPLATLQAAAAAQRRRFRGAVIGITGSVGKTSTKEVLAAVLRQAMPTLHSAKSWNNEIGVPLTLLRLDAAHRAAVIEMGTYGPGEIALLCTWAQPTHAIVTNVGVSHLERMKNSDVVALAKSELPAAVAANGLVVLNGDDSRVRAMAGVTAARSLFYGLDPRNDLWADEIEGLGLAGVRFTVHAEGGSHQFSIPLRGTHQVGIALSAIAIARSLGVAWPAIHAGFADPALQQRLVVIPGSRGTTLLDDTYNAAPASCKAALALLQSTPGRHIAVFGEMAELGPESEMGHREVGIAAANVVDALVVVGDEARWIGLAAQATNAALPVVYVNTNGEAVAWLRPQLRTGDVILVKGARVAATEEIVAALRAPSSEHVPSPPGAAAETLVEAHA